jgi:hypothetical protein
MRKLAEITAPLLAKSFDRHLRERSIGRRRGVVSNTLTCLMLVKHQENETQLFVSTDGDAVGAVWIPKQPVLIDHKDRGRFLVVTLTITLARQHGLLRPVLQDFKRYQPSERAMLEEAIGLAKRTRDRLSGNAKVRMTWSGGRNVFA